MVGVKETIKWREPNCVSIDAYALIVFQEILIGIVCTCVGTFKESFDVLKLLKKIPNHNSISHSRTSKQHALNILKPEFQTDIFSN